MNGPIFGRQCWKEEPDECVDSADVRVDLCHGVREQPRVGAHSDVRGAKDVAKLGHHTAQRMQVAIQRLE